MVRELQVFYSSNGTKKYEMNLQCDNDLVKDGRFFF